MVKSGVNLQDNTNLYLPYLKLPKTLAVLVSSSWSNNAKEIGRCMYSPATLGTNQSALASLGSLATLFLEVLIRGSSLYTKLVHVHTLSLWTLSCSA